MNKMKKTIYIDTSVLGGYFDEEFEADTKLFFDRIQNKDYDVHISEISNIELLPEKNWSNMKTDELIQTETIARKVDFHAVTFFRNVKEQIAKEFEGKTFEEQKELLKKYLSGELRLAEKT